MKLSIVAPIYNEEENIRFFYDEVKKVIDSLGVPYEVICVNDGSTDKSLDILKNLAAGDSKLKVINFRRNFGQTAAMSAGIKHAQGEIIIPMDADLQNDPNDIPKFLTKLKDGYDVVSGWRKNRQDKMLTRRIPSQVANWLIGRLTGVKIHDYGCTMKAYKKELLQEINLYGQMHRFIPVYVSWQGGKVAEIETNHRPRLHGQTKYGLARTYRVILDLVVIKFLSKYMSRPMHFFGGIGFISFFIGVLAGLTAVALKIFHLRDFVATPLPVFSALFVIVGVQLIIMGILAEILMRTYYESQKKEAYIIKDKINF